MNENPELKKTHELPERKKYQSPKDYQRWEDYILHRSSIQMTLELLQAIQKAWSPKTYYGKTAKPRVKHWKYIWLFPYEVRTRLTDFQMKHLAGRLWRRWQPSHIYGRFLENNKDAVDCLFDFFRSQEYPRNAGVLYPQFAEWFPTEHEILRRELPRHVFLFVLYMASTQTPPPKSVELLDPPTSHEKID